MFAAGGAGDLPTPSSDFRTMSALLADAPACFDFVWVFFFLSPTPEVTLNVRSCPWLLTWLPLQRHQSDNCLCAAAGGGAGCRGRGLSGSSQSGSGTAQTQDFYLSIYLSIRGGQYNLKITSQQYQDIFNPTNKFWTSPSPFLWFQRMTSHPQLRVRIRSRFLPVFSLPPSPQCLLSARTIGVKSVASTCLTCKVPWYNFVMIWHYADKVDLIWFKSFPDGLNIL